MLVTPRTSASAAVAAIRAAGGRVEHTAGGVLQVAVPEDGLGRLSASAAVAGVSSGAIASPDAVTSQGVAEIGADALHAQGDQGAGVKIAILDQAFGDVSRFSRYAGTELPPLERQHTMSFDATYGLTGRDYDGNASRHGEFVGEIAYDVAPGAEYWYVNYRTFIEFGQAVDYLVNTVHPDIIIHSNSFLFGPFDGSGSFAQQVDGAAASGILWVNSAGNYRLRHWAGPWSDADADTFLDVPGHGDSIPVTLALTSHPACDVSWTGLADATDYYAIGLFADPAHTQAVIDAHTGMPMTSSFVAAPDAHDDLPPGTLSAPGTYYVGVEKVGNPGSEHLTLYCRMDLPADVDVTSSSSPTPGDATGALSVGAFDQRTQLPQDYSSEGPTLDGRAKPDISAPTNVAISEGQSCGGTSCATPHVAGAAALVWSQVASDGGPGTTASRVAAWLTGHALDMGVPGPDPRYGAGRVRVDLTPPVFGPPSPAPNAAVRGVVQLAVPVVELGTLSPLTMTIDSAPSVGSIGSDAVARAAIDTSRLPDGVHHVGLQVADLSANAAVLDLPLLVDNTPPKLTLRVPRTVLLGHRLTVHSTVRDAGSGLGAPPAVDFGDGSHVAGLAASHAYAKAGKRTIQVVASDRAGNAATAHVQTRAVELLLDATAGTRPSGWVALGRRDRVTLAVRHDGHVVEVIVRTLAAGVHRLPLGRLRPGRYTLIASARGFRAARLLRV